MMWYAVGAGAGVALFVAFLLFTLAIARSTARLAARRQENDLPFHRFPKYMTYAPYCPECGARSVVVMGAHGQWFQHKCSCCKLEAKKAGSWKASRYNWDLLVDQRKKKRSKK